MLIFLARWRNPMDFLWEGDFYRHLGADFTKRNGMIFVELAGTNQLNPFDADADARIIGT